MCIIVVSSFNVPVPSVETLHNCFDHNPDGAGYMFTRNKVLTLKKGFMTWEAFLEAYQRDNITAKDSIVYHFRIGTAGSKSPGNCHPFPFSNNTELLKTTMIDGLPAAIAHNGVFGVGDTKEDLSDTQLFIARNLAHPDIIKNLEVPIFRNLINEALGTGNKVAIMLSTGQIWYYGAGWTSQEGILYSNTSYLPRPKVTYYPDYKNWEEEGAYGEYKPYVPKKTAVSKKLQKKILARPDIWKQSPMCCTTCQKNPTLFCMKKALWYCPHCNIFF
jgi:hypothetical protein